MNNNFLKLATYNIHRSTGTDGACVPERIAHVINGLQADIIGLQEVGWYHRKGRRTNQFDFLREKTGYDIVPGLVRDHDNACFGNALLTRHHVKSYACLNLTVSGNAPRGAVQAILQTNHGALQIIIVHLGLSPWERYRQMKVIADFIRTQPTIPTVVMGDFNQWLYQTEASNQITNLLPGHVHALTFPAQLPVVRLDRMFLSSKIKLLGKKVLKNEITKKASDHLPLLAEVICS